MSTEPPSTLSAVAPWPSAPLISYRSSGKLLIVARCRELSEILDALPKPLESAVLLTEACTPELQKGLSACAIPWQDEAVDIRIEGYLGNFRIETDFQAGRDPATLRSDLVLDLLDPPIMRRSLPPLGYFSRLPQGREILTDIVRLDEWIGEFDKPKFFDYVAGLCAHQASSIPGCSACIEHCAAQAVTSQAGKINVNPYLCQGCGDCAGVCPSGAMRYLYPPPEVTLDGIRAALAGKAAQGTGPCVLVLHDRESEPQLRTDPGRDSHAELLPFALESPGAAGIEVWFAALAYGASAVAILAGDRLYPESRRALTTQIGYANQILEGAGLSVAITLLERQAELGAFIATLPAPPRVPASFAGLRDKRTMVRLALDRLVEDCDGIPEAVTLSEGAPFGAISVDPARCTLCMACVSVCPEHALSDGVDEPRLGFIEANCVQCGICKNACPERAITLVPRYLFNSVEARKTRVLHRNAPFCCIGCGKPFATAKVIQKITEKLKSHPMFQGDKMQRLRMCDECRVKSFFPSRNPGPPQ